MIKVNKNWNVPQKQFTLLQMFVLFEESCVVDGKLSALNVWKRNGYGLGNMCMDATLFVFTSGLFCVQMRFTLNFFSTSCDRHTNLFFLLLFFHLFLKHSLTLHKRRPHYLFQARASRHNVRSVTGFYTPHFSYQKGQRFQQ